MTSFEFAKLFDHTCLAPDAAFGDIKKLCSEAREYGFAMVAVNSVQTALCRRFLSDTDVHVGAAISFPLGQTTKEVKVFEAVNAIENGADEIDYVINITQLKMGNLDYIRDEMKGIVDVCRENGVISKAIFENCYLNKDEIEMLCRIALEEKPDFIKTSTGFGKSGATVEDVRLMKSIVGNEIKIKAAGGIRDLKTCFAMIEAGAERIGTSSAVKILEEFKKI